MVSQLLDRLQNNLYRVIQHLIKYLCNFLTKVAVHVQHCHLATFCIAASTDWVNNAVVNCHTTWYYFVALMGLHPIIREWKNQRLCAVIRIRYNLGCQIIYFRYWANCRVLPFAHTHDLDLVVSRSKFEIALFEVGALIDMERKGCESIIHDHDLWLTMVGWVDVPYSDWGDFGRRRAVDISSYARIHTVEHYEPKFNDHV